MEPGVNLSDPWMQHFRQQPLHVFGYEPLQIDGVAIDGFFEDAVREISNGDFHSGSIPNSTARATH